jgi:hypothetical protein
MGYPLLKDPAERARRIEAAPQTPAGAAKGSRG